VGAAFSNATARTDLYADYGGLLALALAVPAVDGHAGISVTAMSEAARRLREQQRERALQSMALTVGFEVSAHMSVSTLANALYQAQACNSSCALSIQEFKPVSAVAVCGNDFCEAGESHDTCPSDCKFASLQCPRPESSFDACGGREHGACIQATGQCRCFAGYAGNACDECEAGFMYDPTTYNCLINALLLPADPEPEKPTTTEGIVGKTIAAISKLGPGPIAGICIGIASFFVIVTVQMYVTGRCRCCCQKQQEADTQMMGFAHLDRGTQMTTLRAPPLKQELRSGLV
jgi:hypothetical protein